MCLLGEEEEGWLKGIKLNVTDLMSKFLPDREFTGKHNTTNSASLKIIFVAHRALPDVEAVEALFTTSPFHDLLSSLSIRTPQQQIHQWTLQKQKRSHAQCLLRFFGKKISQVHARKLTTEGINHQLLEEWRATCKTREKFIKTLKNHKIHSKVLQENLCSYNNNMITFFTCSCW